MSAPKSPSIMMVKGLAPSARNHPAILFTTTQESRHGLRREDQTGQGGDYAEAPSATDFRFYGEFPPGTSRST